MSGAGAAATALKRQIDELRARATGHDSTSQNRYLQSRKGRPSLLLSPDEAAHVDSTEVLEAAQEGLSHLVSVDARFEAFGSTLFNADAPARELLTASENVGVDAAISSYLRAVSPYVTLKPAQLTLEHLVRRYAVYKHNFGSLMACLLPWHDTPLFAAVVRLGRLSGGGQWAWLSGVAKSGVPPPRRIISRQVARDVSLLSFLCDILAHSASEEACSGESEPRRKYCELVASFWSAVLLDVMDLTQPTEEFVRALLPQLTRGLSAAASPNARAACCLVASALALRTTLSRAAVDAILESVSKRGGGTSAAERRQGLLCATAVCKGQRVPDLSSRAIKRLAAVSSLPEELAALSESFDISALLQPMLRGWVALIEADPSYAQGLKAVALHSGWPSHAFGPHVPHLTQLLVKQCEDDDEDVERVSLLTCLSQRFPKEVGMGLSLASDADNHVVSAFLERALASGTSDLVGSSLISVPKGKSGSASDTLSMPIFLALEHPSAAVRSCAVKSLEKAASGSSNGGESRVWSWGPVLSSALVRRAADPEPTVSSKVLCSPVLREALIEIIMGRIGGSGEEVEDEDVDDDEEKFALRAASGKECLGELIAAEMALCKALQVSSHPSKGAVKALTGMAALWSEVISSAGSGDLDFDVGQTPSAGTLAAIGLIELLPEATATMWQDKASALSVGKSAAAAVAGLNRPHPLLSNLASPGESDSLPPSTLKRACEAMMPLCGEGGRVHLVKALVQSAQRTSAKHSAGFLGFALKVALLEMQRPAAARHMAPLLVDCVRDLPSPAMPGALYLDHHVCLDGNESTGESEATMAGSAVRLLLQVQGTGEALGSVISEQLGMRPLQLLVGLGAAACKEVNDATRATALSCAATHIVAISQKSSLAQLKIEIGQDIVAILPMALSAFSSQSKAVRCAAELLFRSIAASDFGVDVTAPKGKSKKSPSYSRGEMFPGAPAEMLQRVELHVPLQEEVAAIVRGLCASAVDGGLSSDSGAVKQVFAGGTLSELLKPSVLGYFSSHAACLGLKPATIEASSYLWSLLQGCEADTIWPDARLLLLRLFEAESLWAHKNLIGSIMSLVAQPSWCSSCDGAYSAWLAALQRRDFRAPASGIITRSWCSSELNRSQRTEVLTSLLCAAQADNDSDAADVAALVPLSHEDAASLIKALLPGSQNRKKHSTPKKKSKQKCSPETQTHADLLLAACDSSWMTALSCVSELLMRGTIDPSHGGEDLAGEAELADTVFAAMETLCSSDAQVRGTHTAEDVDYGLQCCIELLLGPSFAVKMGSANAGARIAYIGRTLECCLSPGSRHAALKLMASLAAASPQETLAEIPNLLAQLTRAHSEGSSAIDGALAISIVREILPSVKAISAASAPVKAQAICHAVCTCIFDAPAAWHVDLCSSLYEGLGPSALVCVMGTLLSLSNSHGSPGDEESQLEFLCDVCLRARPLYQVRVLGQITRVMRSVFAASEAGLRSNSKAKVDATVLSIVESGGPFLELDLSQWPPGGLPLLAMKWVSLQLGSSQLHTRIVSEPDSVQREMQADFLNLCEELLELLKAVGDSSSQGASEMRTACHEALGLLQALLDLPSFVAVVESLLYHEDALVRKRALDMFIERLDGIALVCTEAERAFFLDMLPGLRAMLRSKAHDSHSVVDKETALLTIQVLCKYFGSSAPGDFAQALDDVCNLLATGLDPSNGLCAAAYVCLASLTSSLRARALPKLPIFLPRMLSSLEGCILGAGQSQKRARHDLLQPTGPTLLLMRSIVSSLAHITEALPQFVHPYLVRILRVVAEPQMGADSSLSSATDILLSLIRTKLESRLVIPALVEAYSNVSINPVAQKRYLSFARQALESAPRSLLVTYLSDVTGVLFKALHPKSYNPGGEDIAEAQSTLLAVVLQLTEAQLRTLIKKIIEWGRADDVEEGSDDCLARRLAFLSVMESLAQTLSTIGVPYVLQIWQDALDALALNPANRDSQSTRASEQALKKRKNKKGRSSVRIDDTIHLGKHSQILQVRAARCALSCVRLCVQHDKSGIVGDERFEAASSATVSLLDTVPSFEDVDEAEELGQAVVECVASLASFPSSDESLRALLVKVLKRTRDHPEQVRVLAVKALSGILSSTGEEGLSLLPDCLPYLQELLEDGSSLVTEAARLLIKDVEEVLGESIQSYMR